MLIYYVYLAMLCYSLLPIVSWSQYISSQKVLNKNHVRIGLFQYIKTHFVVVLVTCTIFYLVVSIFLAILLWV